MKTLALASATIALALSASPALANTTIVPTQTIETADLNLETPQGQARLEQRIKYAAREVCGFYDTRSNSRIRSPEVSECLVAARASAQRQVAAMIEDQRRGG